MHLDVLKSVLLDVTDTQIGVLLDGTFLKKESSRQ